jgi:uncharacterized protein with HEPN domain
MSQRDDRHYLGQMLEYANEIERTVAHLSRAEFDDDTHAQSHVIRYAQYIGEAGRNVSRTLKEAHPEIDWPKIIGMRHRLVHRYDEIDLTVVWSTATIDIPHLVTALTHLLP